MVLLILRCLRLTVLLRVSRTRMLLWLALRFVPLRFAVLLAGELALLAGKLLRLTLWFALWRALAVLLRLLGRSLLWLFAVLLALWLALWLLALWLLALLRLLAVLLWLSLRTILRRATLGLSLATSALAARLGLTTLPLVKPISRLGHNLLLNSKHFLHKL